MSDPQENIYHEVHMNKRRIGARGEDEAAAFLEKQGLHILERNFRTREGEIDIVAQDGDILVFVEVKYRSSARYGDALEAVDRRKMYQIRKTARAYLYRRSPGSVRIRFDVIGITGGRLTWVRDVQMDT